MSTPLHTIRTGPSESATAVLWVHGVDSDAHVWDPAVELVSDHHLCVGVDLPGHGESPEPDDAGAYERTAVLDDLDAVINEIRSEQPDRHVVLVGHSLGGYLGLAHVLTRNEDPARLDGLVLVATGPGFRDPDSMASWNERVSANATKYSVSELAATIAFHSDSLVMDGLGDLTVPVALVIGDGDKGFLGANDYLERKLPHARRITVEGGRHFVMRSHPEAVAEGVDHVLSELEVE